MLGMEHQRYSYPNHQNLARSLYPYNRRFTSLSEETRILLSLLGSSGSVNFQAITLECSRSK